MGADQSKSAGSDIVVVNEETSPVKTADKVFYDLSLSYYLLICNSVLFS